MNIETRSDREKNRISIQSKSTPLSNLTDREGSLELEGQTAGAPGAAWVLAHQPSRVVLVNQAAHLSRYLVRYPTCPISLG